MYLIYGRPGCRWCVRATRLAHDMGVDYDYIDISESEFNKQFILNEGHTTVPQVYFMHDEGQFVHIGGYTDFEAELIDTQSKEDVPENGS